MPDLGFRAGGDQLQDGLARVGRGQVAEVLGRRGDDLVLPRVEQGQEDAFEVRVPHPVEALDGGGGEVRLVAARQPEHLLPVRREVGLVPHRADRGDPDPAVGVVLGGGGQERVRRFGAPVAEQADRGIALAVVLVLLLLEAPRQLGVALLRRSDLVGGGRGAAAPPLPRHPRRRLGEALELDPATGGVRHGEAPSLLAEADGVPEVEVLVAAVLRRPLAVAVHVEQEDHVLPLVEEQAVVVVAQGQAPQPVAEDDLPDPVDPQRQREGGAPGAEVGGEIRLHRHRALLAREGDEQRRATGQDRTVLGAAGVRVVVEVGVEVVVHPDPFLPGRDVDHHGQLELLAQGDAAVPALRHVRRQSDAVRRLVAQVDRLQPGSSCRARLPLQRRDDQALFRVLRLGHAQGSDAEQPRRGQERAGDHASMVGGGAQRGAAM